MAVDTPEPAASARQVALNTLANYGGRIINFATWFALTPLIVEHLSKDQYGLWGEVATFTAYGSLANLGIGSALIKYVAEYRARNENEVANELIATALALFCALGVLVIIIGIALSPLVPDIIHVSHRDRGVSSMLLIVTSIAVAVQLPSTAAIGVLAGLGRFPMMNLIGGTATITTAGVTVAVLLLGGKVIAITLVIVPITLLWIIPTVWLIHRAAPELRFRLRGARLAHARQVTAFASAVFGIQLAQTIKLQSDELVIGAAKNVSLVGPYSIARRLSTAPGQLSAQFTQVLLPMASRMHAEGDATMLRQVYLVGLRLTFALYAAIGAALITLAAPFLSAWVGHRFASSADIVVILTIAAVFEALMLASANPMLGMSRHRPIAVLALASAVLNLALSIVLIETIGLEGVALGTLIATTLEASIALPYGARTVGVRLGQVIHDVIVPSLAPLVPAVAVMVVLRAAAAPTSLIAVIGTSTLR